MRPPVHGPAHGGGFLLGEHAEQFAAPPVRGAGQHLREVVQRPVPVRVQQCLRGGRHGRVRRRGQRPLVVEPADEVRLHGDGVGGEQPGGGVEVPVRAGRLRVGEDQAAQQVEALGAGQRRLRPEGGPELPGHRPSPPPPVGDRVGEQPQDPEVRRGVRHPAQRLAEQPGRPPGVRVGVQGEQQFLQADGEPVRAVLPGEQEQGLHDGAGAVVREGRRPAGAGGAAVVDQRPQGLVQVEVDALEPVGDLLVGEAVAGAGRDEQAFGQDGGRPAGAPAEPGRGPAPGEQRLERVPVQLAVPGAEAAPGGLVDLPGHLRREPPHGGAAQAVLGGEPYRHPQAHQVEVGGEDGVPVERAVRADVRAGGEDLAEEPEGEGVAGVGGGEGPVGEAVPGVGAAGLGLVQVAQRDAGGQAGGCRARVEAAGREGRPGLLPVLRPARHDQARPRLLQPPRGLPGPGGQAVGQGRGHLLGAVEEQQQGLAGGAGRPGQAVGAGVAEQGAAGPVEQGAAVPCRRHDPGRPVQRPPHRVRHRRVPGPQVGPAQPHRGGPVPRPGRAGRRAPRVRSYGRCPAARRVRERWPGPR
ncbi:hypothetical protein GCM10020295_22060 [Streptomyces cinereospinus]